MDKLIITVATTGGGTPKQKQPNLPITPKEIAEAVTMSALTRHWSTFFNGMQVDLDTFKKELGGETAKQE